MVWRTQRAGVNYSGDAKLIGLIIGILDGEAPSLSVSASRARDSSVDYSPAEVLGSLAAPAWLGDDWFRMRAVHLEFMGRRADAEAALQDITLHPFDWLRLKLLGE
jgi:hypothetical protein